MRVLEGRGRSISYPEPPTSARAGFPVAEARVWLDSRLVYHGSGDGPLQLNLEGVEEGEYVLRLDLLDPQGALYQRAQRVSAK